MFHPKVGDGNYLDMMTTLSLGKCLLKKMTGRDHRHEKVHSK